ncbi:MAG TPA: type II toxin-antitoxin system VapC family toxin [Candidatus Altiarchaeales archaeon]|nr:type II toxin-antitoxin system VapC family toxin [Candidatus Altiarchaeales archaeon]
MSEVVIDTNVLVYLITDERALKNKDQIDLVQRAKRKFKEVLRENNIILSSVTLVELANILNYKVGVDESRKLLEKIIFNEKLRIETPKPDELIEALTISNEKNVKYTDCLIYLIAKRLGAKIFSYDTDFEKFTDVEMV